MCLERQLKKETSKSGLTQGHFLLYCIVTMNLPRITSLEDAAINIVVSVINRALEALGQRQTLREMARTLINHLMILSSIAALQPNSSSKSKTSHKTPTCSYAVAGGAACIII